MGIWTKWTLAEYVHVRHVAMCTPEQQVASLRMAQEIAPEVQGRLLALAVDGTGEAIAAALCDGTGMIHVVCDRNRILSEMDQANVLSAVQQDVSAETPLEVMLHLAPSGKLRMQPWPSLLGLAHTHIGAWLGAYRPVGARGA